MLKLSRGFRDRQYSENIRYFKNLAGKADAESWVLTEDIVHIIIYVIVYFMVFLEKGRDYGGN